MEIMLKFDRKLKKTCNNPVNKFMGYKIGHRYAIKSSKRY